MSTAPTPIIDHAASQPPSRAPNMLARSALAAQARIAAGDTDPFFPAKIATARYYADHAMSSAPGLCTEIIDGGASTLALPDAMF